MEARGRDCASISVPQSRRAVYRGFARYPAFAVAFRMEKRLTASALKVDRLNRHEPVRCTQSSTSAPIGLATKKSCATCLSAK